MSNIKLATLQPDNLRRAWQYLRNDKALWAPSVNRDDLVRNLPYHHFQLLEDLRNECYRPQAMRQFVMIKGDGKKRVLSAQYLRDKLAQRLVLQAIEPIGEAMFHMDSFGYRPGRGVLHAVVRVKERVRTGLVWLVDADIEKFFDRIPHAPLRKRVKQIFRDAWLQQLIEQWLEVGYHSASLFGVRRGLAQGAVLSPFLCNFYLHDFDRALTRANITFVRYADDFLLMTPNETKAKNAYHFAQKQLIKMGLNYNQEKTRIRRASPSVIFLGKKLPRYRE